VEVKSTVPGRTNDPDQIVLDDEVEDQIEIKDREEIIDVDPIVIDDEGEEGTGEDQIEIINDDQIEVFNVDPTETVDDKIEIINVDPTETVHDDKIEIINVDPTETVDDDKIHILSEEKTVTSKALAGELGLKRRKKQSCFELKSSKTNTQEEKTEAGSKTVNTILDNSTEKV